jgi:hypothetical protein
MAVKESPLLWRTFSDENVELSKGGTVARAFREHDEAYAHVTTSVELTEGRHYWEVELLSEVMNDIFVGVTRPNLDPVGDYMVSDCTDGWFINIEGGSL